MKAPSKRRSIIEEIRSLFFIFFGAILFLLCSLFCLIWGFTNADIDNAREQKTLLYARELAVNFFGKPALLVELAAKAAVVNDPSIFKKFEEISVFNLKDVSQGKWRANLRTEQKIKELLTSLRGGGAVFTNEELDDLGVSIRETEEAIKTATESIKAAQGIFKDEKGDFTIEAGPDVERASKMLQNPDYLTRLANIKKAERDFVARVELRLYDLPRQGIQLSRLFSKLSLAVLGILIFSVPAMAWVLYRKVHERLSFSRSELRKSRDDLARVHAMLEYAKAEKKDLQRRYESTTDATPFRGAVQGKQAADDDFLTKLP